MTTIVSIDNSDRYTWGGNCDGWHLLKADNLSVIQELVPPGGAEIKHYHTRAHQFFFVLAGQATLEIEGKRLTIGPHQGISVPPGIPHRLVNEGEKNLSFLVISSPKSHGDRVPVD